MACARSILSAVLLSGAPAWAAPDGIWVEGEAAASAEVVRHSWYRSVKKDLLSEGDWLAHFGERDGIARYEVRAPAAGRYVLWVRANPIQSSLSYRLGEGDWTAIDTRKARDSMNIADDDKPDLRFLAWLRAGEVELGTAPATISFKMHSANHHHGGIDCFYLSRGRFRPQGASRPGRKSGLADPGTWPFEPEEDGFEAAAALDLRGLNEETAGRSGWVRRTAEGGFALGDGRPARFWAANTTVQESGDAEDLAYHARFLAKRGVNMVRFHGAIWPKGSDARLTDVDGEEIDRCQRLVAAMKKEGIYTTISPYWAITATARPSWRLRGHPTGNVPALLFWDENLQAAYRGWLRELLTRPNPHAGGLPLAKDPAMAVLQIQNEDSMLFWTLGTVKGEELARLRAHHGRWLRARHGSLEKALQAWNGHRAEGDDPPAGAMGLLGLWEYGQRPAGGKRARLADQARYLAETMRAFNASIVAFVREELGCPVLINAGNWRTANDDLLIDAERWSYAAADVIGANRYFTGAHQCPGDQRRAGYLVQKGDLFTEESALLVPWKLPVNMKQVAGLPSIVSESTWVPPLSRQAEGPFLVAAYSSLSGVDALYWFTLGSPGYDTRLVKWQAANPAILGGWPAAALLFRKGYLRQAEPVVHEERRLEDLWGAAPAAIAESGAFDPNRDASEGTAGRKDGHPLAFLVGPVEVKYGGDPARTRIADLRGSIDARARTVTSATREIRLDWGRGLATLDAPHAQGACGFLKAAGAIQLGQSRIDSTNEYGALLLVSLDDQDLARSRKVLVQATTTCRPHGWRESEAELESGKRTYRGKRIDDTGGAPWNVVRTAATVTLRNQHLRKATVLDPNFMPAGETPCETRGGALSLRMPEDGLYVILE